MIINITATAYPVNLEGVMYVRVTRTVYVFGKALFKSSTIRA